jgi:hypothetical protein
MFPNREIGKQEKFIQIILGIIFLSLQDSYLKVTKKGKEPPHPFGKKVGILFVFF